MADYSQSSIVLVVHNGALALQIARALAPEDAELILVEDEVGGLMYDALKEQLQTGPVTFDTLEELRRILEEVDAFHTTRDRSDWELEDRSCLDIIKPMLYDLRVSLHDTVLRKFKPMPHYLQQGWSCHPSSAGKREKKLSGRRTRGISVSK